VSALRPYGGDQLSDAEIRVRLATAGPLPEALRSEPPRPDAFSDRGYLAQTRHCAKYLPLLCHGRATRGVCSGYRSRNDGEGNDVRWEIAWLDEEDRVRRVAGKESYDPMHAALANGQGEIVVDMDAGLRLGELITVVYQERDWVIFESLGV
jgi:hypothetical protein